MTYHRRRANRSLAIALVALALPLMNIRQAIHNLTTDDTISITILDD